MLDLARALDVATEAALQAGRLLRDELYRADGPRGHGSHADVDTEAEEAIRRRLTEEFPEWSYWGEETGARRTERTDPFWLIDPNDGTHAYLRGQRGSAVSIALIHQGAPVLGVVYAPCHPDDGGDLICWAEGCGPPTRNGETLPPRHFAERLEAAHVVLVSADADRAPAQNLGCCAPARYRAMPSIAYRLALVAVGEGEVAASLQGPGWLDVAGGHALIRGAGGDLVDGKGQTVRYPHFGNETVSSVFGGAPQPARELARREWHAVLSAREPHDLLPFPVRPPAVRRRLPDGVLARAQGVLLGQVAGDNLGALVEFHNAAQVAALYPQGPRRLEDGGHWNLLAGQATDDSEMALALARSMVRRNEYDARAAFQAYRAWIGSEPFDSGRTTRRALGGESEEPYGEGRNFQSQANGSLMRVSPLGVAGWARPDAAAAWAAADAELTHPHPVCVEACQVAVRALTAGLHGASRVEMYETALSASDHTRDWLRAARDGPPDDFSHHAGWVRIALQNAFFRLLHCDSLEEAVVQTVREGGDTDTNAAIAGALAGALFGRDGVPFQWRQSVLSCRPHRAYAESRHPRPPFCWPTDVLDLAERLIYLP